MPEKDCVTIGNKIYYWNDETGEIDVYTRRSMQADQCPPEILVRLLRLLGGKGKK